jgi:ribosomal protein S6--L-glutamate ligase
LASRSRTASNHRLIHAAAARGHVAEVLDPANLTLLLNGPVPGLAGPDGALAHYDAVIARMGSEDGPHGPAVVRQLEMMGSFALNSADAIERLGNRLAMMQVLAGQGVACRSHLPQTTAAAVDDAVKKSAVRTRMLVVGGRVAAALRRRGGVMIDAGGRKLKAERTLAERAAGALNLGLASVDVASSAEHCEVTRISSDPALGNYEAATGVLVAETIIAEMEAHVRSWVLRPGPRGLAAKDQ